MLSLQNLSKSYGDRILFDNVTLTVGAGERIGLVGRNGHGKTTLLNIIAGQDSSDSGGIIAPRGYRIGYFSQHLHFSMATSRDEAVSALHAEKKDSPYLAEKVISGLGFTADMFRQPPSELSGGYKARLNLAKLLISEPNLLLLDEPTNHLDVLSVRWLKNFLLHWKGEVVFVTHDRSFMDSSATHIAGIHRQKVRKTEGDTEKYYSLTAHDEEIYEKTRLNDEAKRKEMDRFITRFRAKARLGGLVQSRIKTLAKMEKKNRLEAISELEFSFRYKNIAAETVLNADRIMFAYPGGKPLFTDISFALNKGDRLCVIGRNGAGKSTLLRILAGRLPPSAGGVLSHDYAAGGYFGQTDMELLRPEATVEEEVAQAGEYKLDRTAVRNICASMLFSGDEALKKIKILSGGEKCRVMLGKIVARPCGWLLLDEPTNHLDMDASDSLLEALNGYQGAVVIVTHNEMFLHTLANRLIVFQGDKPFLFEGGYAEFLEKIGWDDDEGGRQGVVSRKPDRKEQKKQRAELISEKGRVLRPLVVEIESAEAEIIANEGYSAELHKLIEEATAARDGKKLTELGNKLTETQNLIDRLYLKLNDVTVEYEKQSAYYEMRQKNDL
ncbi:MAG: ATP-binding cassette domain-containing protein [Deferribacteraceae bacterium]|jgi:ATP-binding cassette subfamily F protein 3|nr:ATP-binding cassette domain-containing protein [Deferribacteraceae bacterium]